MIAGIAEAGTSDMPHSVAPRARRTVLRRNFPPDAFLSEIARAHPPYRFLGRAAQAVIIRQVKLLAAILDARFGGERSVVRILDWGAGKGQISYLLKEEGFAVTSCELRQDFAGSGMQPDGPIIRAKSITVVPLDDPVALPFDDGAFDCVVSFGVLEHVQDDEASLRQIRRILKPGGILFVTFLPYRLSWTQWVHRLRGGRYHDRLYSRGGLAALAARTRFDIADMWLGQLLPKGTMPACSALERLDRFMTDWTPLKFFATNIEAVLVAR